jgi:hypothetical protein
MHFPTAFTVLSGLAFAATSAAYDTITFTTWNCTDCTPVPGQFCSTGSRTLPPNQCFTMWPGSTVMKTSDPTLPSCQGKVFDDFFWVEERAKCMQSTFTHLKIVPVFQRCTSTTAADARARYLRTLTRSLARECSVWRVFVGECDRTVHDVEKSLGEIVEHSLYHK